jgi:hypothetical protein
MPIEDVFEVLIKIFHGDRPQHMEDEHIPFTQCKLREAPQRAASQILRFAQDDISCLQISTDYVFSLTDDNKVPYVYYDEDEKGLIAERICKYGYSSLCCGCNRLGW